MNKQDIINTIKLEFDKITQQTKQSLVGIKSLAISEAWKILQLSIALLIQIIEKIATDLSGPDKKIIAMDILSKFYDNVFVVIDIPFVPNVVEPVIHKYVKGILMALVGASIDAMVTTFKQVGVFKDKLVIQKVNSKNIKSNKKRKKT